MARPRKKDPVFVEIQQRRSVAPWPLRYPHALAAYWDLAKGDHPSHAKPGLLFELEPFFKNEERVHKFEQYDIPLIPCIDGHNLMADNTIPAAAGADYKVPISPLFVKDLCGRVIYIGVGPETKTDEDWRVGRDITFPDNCAPVQADMEGADMLEDVFFTRFRALEMAFDFTGTPSGDEDLAYGAHYAHANLYPYKLRPDTFYQDGWRLPQTEMVFALQDKDLPISSGETAAENFMHKWHSRPDGQTYEEFYDANSGEEWFEQLFKQGCTVIPTLEACNGYAQVGKNFDIEGYWPGRAVVGLHEITDKRPSEAPANTILEVLEPGYVLRQRILPARVVVSDGSGYRSPHTNDPEPMRPDFRLPHTRTAVRWENIHVPTHPKHFEVPAVWGWDVQTGRFLQTKGPIWDPLHYYYASVPQILRAYRQTLPENPYVAPVPEEMKSRFYPVTEMKGFDTISHATRQAREQNGVFPISSIDHIRDGKTLIDVGYHPMPMAYEMELDSAWFPELAPNHRAGDMPQGLDNFAPVIKSTVLPQTYLNSITGPQEADWLYDASLLDHGKGQPTEDYPDLKRFLGGEADEEVIDLTPIFLEHIPDKVLNMTAQSNWYDADIHSKVDEIEYGLFDELFEMREKGLAARKERHQLYRKNPGWYAVALWKAIYFSAVNAYIDSQGDQGEDEQQVLPAAFGSAVA